MLVIAVQEAGAKKKKKKEEANVVKQEVHIFRDNSE